MSGNIHNQLGGDGFFSAVIQARDIGSVTIQLPPQVPAALSGLPPGSASFTGRDRDLEALLECLAPTGRGSGVMVTGMGGIGKTELAVQAARTALGEGWFPGGVLFVDMFGYDPDVGRRVEPGQALEGYLRALSVPSEPIPAAAQDRSRLLRSVLAAYAQQDRRVLVVIDNVSDTAQAAPLLPSDGTSAAIVTSRHTLADLDVRLLNLDTLETKQAVELLDRTLKGARSRRHPNHRPTQRRSSTGSSAATRPDSTTA